MNEYNVVVDELRTSLQSFTSRPLDSWKREALRYTDGFAAEELRNLVELEKRRNSGAFFTSKNLALKVFSMFKNEFSNQSIFYDPACGAGNLLISAFEIFHELDVLKDIHQRLLGTDIHEEFVETARIRLLMAQLLKAPTSKLKTNSEFILKANGLEYNPFYEKATHIIVNPPFNLVEAEEELEWAKGKISSAALFIHKIIKNTNPGVKILAILPDVLRSGSRYEEWRKSIKSECDLGKPKLLGQFDQYTDVDVFAMVLTKRTVPIRRSQRQLKSKKSESTTMLGFGNEICVGTVVDNRDPRKGKMREYFVSRGLPPWEIQIKSKLKRKHEGKSFDGPFVVIKRTSRMGDEHRAIATIINSPKPVYIDNHLIIVKPNTGTLKDCRKILKLLRRKKTDNWINKQIRCRHLTVRVVSRIPV